MTSSDELTETEKLQVQLKLLNLFGQNLRKAITKKRSGTEDLSNNIPERAASLLTIMSAIIRLRVPDWDDTPVELLIEELTDIARGAAPNLLSRPMSAPNSAPLKTSKNEHYGRLFAAIILLERHGLKKDEAIKYVARRTSVPISTLKTLYKKIRSGNKSKQTLQEAEVMLKAFQKASNKKEAALLIIRKYRKLEN